MESVPTALWWLRFVEFPKKENATKNFSPPKKKKQKNDFSVFFFFCGILMYTNTNVVACAFFFFFLCACACVRADWQLTKNTKGGENTFFFFCHLGILLSPFFSPFLLSFLLSRSTFLRRKEEVPAKNKHAAVLSSSSYFHPFLYNCVFFSFCFVLLLPVLSLFVVWKCAAIKVYLGFFRLTFRKGGGWKKNTQI